MDYTKILPAFWHKHKFLLIALGLVHIAFTVIITREIYLSMGNSDIERGLDFSALFEQVVNLNVSDGEARTVFAAKDFNYPLPELGLSLSVDTGKYIIRKAKNGVTIIDRYSNPTTVFSLSQRPGADLDVQVEADKVTMRLSNRAGYVVNQLADFGAGDVSGPAYLLQDQPQTQLLGLFENEGKVFQITKTIFAAEAVMGSTELNEFISMISFGNIEEEVSATQVSELNLSQQASLIAAKPAVARIYARGCAQLVGVGTEPYQICDTQLASGFYINYEGYLATTSQLSVFDKDQLLRNAILDFYGIDALASWALRNNSQLVDDQGKVHINYDMRTLVQLLEGNPLLRLKLADSISVNTRPELSELDLEFLVQGNDQVFDLDINGDLLNAEVHMVAEMVGRQTDNGYTLLKLSDPQNLPVLRLGTEPNTPGTPLFAITYPAVQTDLYNFSARDSGNQDLQIIDLVEAVDLDQVATNIDVAPGLVGAPLLNQDGYVVGMLTPEQDDQRLLVLDNTKLFELMADYQLVNEVGVVGQKWQQAVDDFNGERYRAAIEGFEEIQAQAPSEFVEQLKVVAQQRVQAGYDKTNGLLGLRTTAFDSYTQREVVTVIGSSTGLILLAIGSFFSMIWIWIVRFSNNLQIQKLGE